MKMIEIEKLKKSFGKEEILKEISFGVDEGDVVAIIGNSGSGKSTLLRCLVDLERPDDGSIKVGGEYIIKNGVLSDSQALKKITLNMGMVFQNYNLFPHLTVTENLVMPYVTIKVGTKEQGFELCYKLLEKVGMLHRKDNYPGTLSGGEKQRVAIARALMLNPKVMLFDEPTAALDPRLTNDIFEIINQIAKDNMTIVVVTHELNFAKMVANKVVFMSGGKIEEVGTPEEIFDNPKSKKLKDFLALSHIK
ncbi:MAG: amino acid ABC transporter ATP-binding protein [Oscillospiraceae bacterium]